MVQQQHDGRFDKSVYTHYPLQEIVKAHLDELAERDGVDASEKLAGVVAALGYRRASDLWKGLNKQNFLKHLLPLMDVLEITSPPERRHMVQAFFHQACGMDVLPRGLLDQLVPLPGANGRNGSHAAYAVADQALVDVASRSAQDIMLAWVADWYTTVRREFGTLPTWDIDYGGVGEATVKKWLNNSGLLLKENGSAQGNGVLAGVVEESAAAEAAVGAEASAGGKKPSIGALLKVVQNYTVQPIHQDDLVAFR